MSSFKVSYSLARHIILCLIYEYYIFQLTISLFFLCDFAHHYVHFTATSANFYEERKRKKKQKHRKSSLAGDFQHAIIWKASINFLIVQIDSRKQEVPRKRAERNRPHTSRVKRVREISWISPTKVRVLRFIVKRGTLKTNPKAHVIYDGNVEIHDATQSRRYYP